MTKFKYPSGCTSPLDRLECAYSTLAGLRTKCTDRGTASRSTFAALKIAVKAKTGKNIEDEELLQDVRGDQKLSGLVPMERAVFLSAYNDFLQWRDTNYSRLKETLVREIVKYRTTTGMEFPILRENDPVKHDRARDFKNAALASTRWKVKL